MDRAIRKASASHTSVESNVEDAAEELAVYYSTSLFARGNAPDEDSPIPQAELTRYAIEKVYGGLPGADDRGYYIAQWLEDKIKKSFDAGDIPEGLYHVGNPRDMVRQGRVWTTIVPGTEGMKVQYDEKGKAFAGPLYMIHYYDQAGQRQTLRQNGEYAAFRPYMTGDAAVDEQRAREIDRTAKERAARSMQKLTRKGGFDRLVTTIYPFAEEILYFRHRWQDDDLQ